ncbi:MAG: hypothetical protein Q9160_005105 [Pyrenula sp. 1 TL-2023]
MKVTTILSSFMLVASTIAAPRSRLADRIARREPQSDAKSFHRSRPVILAGGSEKDILAGGAANVTYSGNWAGAVISNPPTGQTWNSVSAQVKIPQACAPPSSPTGTYAVSAWVGIDGDTCSQAILQGGVDIYVHKLDNGTETTTYDPWYEFFPDISYSFSGFDVKAGNTIQMTVHANSLTDGSVTLENLSTLKNVSKDLSSSVPLCGSNAEWIMEDFVSSGTEVNLADFGAVTFDDAKAGTENSILQPELNRDKIYAIKDGDTIYTNTTIATSHQVTVTYV